MSARAANKASKKNKGRGTTKKQEKKAKRRDRRRQEMDTSVPRIGDSDLDWGSEHDSDLQDGPAIDEAVADYVQNLSNRLPTEGTAVKTAGDSNEESEAANDDVDMEALRHFAMGMGAGQVSINDIEDARRQQEEDEEDGWVDSSGSEASGAEDEKATPITGPEGLEEGEQDDVDESSGDEDGLKPDELDEEDDEEDDYDDDDYQYFKGKCTWADDSEGFIQNIEVSDFLPHMATRTHCSLLSR
jgi:hypothetical protein